MEKTNREKRERFQLLSSLSYPSAKAPDHCRRNPNRADIRIGSVLLMSQLKERTPGGSSKGIRATKNKTVIGVVFHINLFRREPSIFILKSQMRMLVVCSTVNKHSYNVDTR